MKKISQNSKLSDKNIKDFINAYDLLAKLDSQIVNRTEYILKTICKTCNAIYDDDWSIDNHSYCDLALTAKSISKEILFSKKDNLIYYYGLFDIKPNKVEWDNFSIIDKDNNLLLLEEYFPKRWLFEDFEEELNSGRKKYVIQENERHAKELLAIKENKKVNDKKILQIKKKLSTEELELLTFHIKGI